MIKNDYLYNQAIIEFNFTQYMLKHKMIKHNIDYFCNLCNDLITYNLSKNINYMVNNHFKLMHKNEYKEIEFKIARFDSLDLW